MVQQAKDIFDTRELASLPHLDGHQMMKNLPRTPRRTLQSQLMMNLPQTPQMHSAIAMMMTLLQGVQLQLFARVLRLDVLLAAAA
jgi:hypothetical protein